MNEITKIESNPNLRIWNDLGKTDPEQTKGFQRGGGFRGTAMKPMWMNQRLTEVFGPCGTGWGMEKPEFQVIHASEGEVLVYCTVAGWYNEGGEGVSRVYGVGGDKVVGKNKNGLNTDDEAFKKAYTDAIGNAFKFIGVAADIHMGLFDDSKYVESVAAEFRAKAEEVARDLDERQKVPGISKIKERLNAFMIAGNACTDLEAFRGMVKANKDDLKTIREANHIYWTGDGGGKDEFEGYEKWMARRYGELTPVELSDDAKMLIDTLEECTTGSELQGWLRLYGDRMEALDGAEGRTVEARFNDVEAGLKAADNVGAG